MNPLLITILLLVAVGALLVVGGIALLAGEAWAMIAGGGALCIGAYILRGGLTLNG